MRIVYVNSTLGPTLRPIGDGWIGAIHDWGFRPGADDVLLAHRPNRVEITLRARLGGLDPSLLLRTCWYLARGAQGLYLVTQPDLWQALPWLRRRFPRKRFVTWAWMDWEVDLHLSQLRVCDHVLCLTEGAKQRLDAAGMADRSSLALWGCRPDACDPTDAPDTEILWAGRTGRDVTLVREAIALGRYTVLATRRAADGLAAEPTASGRLRLTEVESAAALAAVYRRCHVTWIPLLPGDRYPSGYTNLVESLLCGTTVVIGDCSTIPGCVLALPGVFRYRTGSREDFLCQTDCALEFARRAGARPEVATKAAGLLNGAALERTVHRALGLS